MMAIVVTLGIAAFIRFFHYCIGSPSIDPETGNPATTSGRIFSIWGRFISNRYVEFENKQNARIWAKFNAYKIERLKQHELNMSGAKPDEQTKLIENLSNELQSTQDRIHLWKKPNPWMAAGLCPICFGTWVALLFWLLAPIMFGINPGFIIFGIAASVIISNRIKL